MSETTAAEALADVESEHRADYFGDDDPICRRCGVAYPCQKLLAAQGRPTVPCTACSNADDDGDDVWAFVNRWVIHPECAQVLQPRDEAGMAEYQRVRDTARLEALDRLVNAPGVGDLSVESVLQNVRSLLAMP